MQLGFCYVCGEPFTEDDPRTRDHVPPRSVFQSDDRNWPLILPATSSAIRSTLFPMNKHKDLLPLCTHPAMAFRQSARK